GREYPEEERTHHHEEVPPTTHAVSVPPHHRRLPSRWGRLAGVAQRRVRSQPCGTGPSRRAPVTSSAVNSTVAAPNTPARSRSRVDSRSLVAALAVMLSAASPSVP